MSEFPAHDKMAAFVRTLAGKQVLQKENHLMATPQPNTYTVTFDLPNAKPLEVEAEKYELKEGFYEFALKGKLVAVASQPHVVSIEVESAPEPEPEPKKVEVVKETTVQKV